MRVVLFEDLSIQVALKHSIKYRRLVRSLVTVLGAYAAGRFLQKIDPAYRRAIRLFGERNVQGGTMLCVYRAKNWQLVETLAHEAEQAHLTVHLWALDTIADRLAQWTRGSGAGSRTELLNQLWITTNHRLSDRVVVCDDDITFTRGGIQQLVNGSSYCGFQLAQPTHASGSYASHSFTRCQTFTIARLTNWVDIGPMFIVNGSWVDKVLPFPENFGMGWGLDLLWQQSREEGCRFGILDAICIQHLKRTSLEYELSPEYQRLSKLLDQFNLRSISEAQKCFSSWMFWQSRPNWLRYPSND